MRPFFLAVVALFAAFAEAQLTETIVDANAESVVIVVSTNTLLGVITTETLETLTGTTAATTNTRTRATTATTTATTATTTLAQGGGVVGAPATTTNDDPHGPTPYTYTTVIGGITTLIEDTFTPSFPATTPSTAPATGSIMAFSQYQSIYGTVSASSANSAAVILVSQKALMGLVATTVVCLLGGVWTILP